MKAYSLATGVFASACSSDTPAIEFLLLEILKNDDNVALQELCIQHIAEVQALASGLSELRKSLHPLFRTGPQYDGWLAVEDFHKYLSARLRARKAQRVEQRRESARATLIYNTALAAFKADHGRKPDVSKSELTPYYQKAKQEIEEN